MKINLKDYIERQMKSDSGFAEQGHYALCFTPIFPEKRFGNECKMEVLAS